MKRLNPPMRVLSVFGTRPEAIKMAPVIHALENDPSFLSLVCVTAQHRELLDQVLSTFSITPDFDLNLMRPGQSLSALSGRVLEELAPVVNDARPDMVLVHGDTSTTLASALTAFHMQVPVGHVEAGLRSFDMLSPFPEEMNRVLTSRLAKLHFCPTQENAAILYSEGIMSGIHITGNTAIDALIADVRPDYRFQSEALQAVDFSGRRTILLTAHRRENWGAPMDSIFRAIKTVLSTHEDVQIIFPVHPNPIVRNAAQERLGGNPRVHLIDPLDVLDMHNLISRCELVVTDSGGLQEEAPALHKPVLVLRNDTERTEGIAAGTARLIGTNAIHIVESIHQLLNEPAEYARMANAVNPYGDGHASQRILDALLEYNANSIESIAV